MQSVEPMFDQFLALWRALPHSQGALPCKRDFGPALAPKLMPHMFLAEYTGHHQLTVRLIGTTLESSSGFHFTGNNYFDHLPKADWEIYDAFVCGYLEKPCAGRVLRRVYFPNGLIYDMHSLAAPLADASGKARFVIGIGAALPNHLASANNQKSGPGYLQGGGAYIETAEYIDLGYGVPPQPDLSHGQPSRARAAG